MSTNGSLPLVTEFHYKGGDVGVHPAMEAEIGLWETFTTMSPPSHIVIRPDTPEGAGVKQSLAPPPPVLCPRGPRGRELGGRGFGGGRPGSGGVRGQRQGGLMAKMKMVCKACKKRGKTWQGDDPRCAFEAGKFDGDNWSCATADLIRDVCYEGQDLPNGVDYQYCEDQKYVTVKVDHIEGLDGALALWVSWHKQRCITDAMWLLFEHEQPRVPTEQECLRIAQAYRSNTFGDSPTISKETST